LRRHFNVFTRAHEADATSLPAKVAASFDNPSQASLNYEPDASAAVYEKPDPGDAFGFWIVPGRSGACIVWQTTAVIPSAHANCLALSAVDKSGMTEISSADGPTLVFGFLPNGARSVTVTNTDGSMASSPVVGNTYLIVDSKSSIKSIATESGSAQAPQISTRSLEP
jgi:hypothetical protein